MRISLCALFMKQSTAANLGPVSTFSVDPFLSMMYVGAMSHTPPKPTAPPVYRPTLGVQPSPAAPPVYRHNPNVQARMAPPPVYRPVVGPESKPNSAPPVYRPNAGPAQSHMASSRMDKANAGPPMRRSNPLRKMAIQRKVLINRGKPYDGNEAIADFEYFRLGSAGGNHFVSDKLVQNLIGEMVTSRSRDDAADYLTDFWNGTGFVGILTFNKTNAATYDDSIDSLCSSVSNQPSNLFDCLGSGDSQGNSIDVPNTQTARARVVGYAKKLLKGLDAVPLGDLGKEIHDQLATFIYNNT